MSTRNYRLYATGVVTADAVASLKIARSGTITSIFYNVYGVAGAAVDGRGILEVSKQSVKTVTTNDTPPTVLSHCSIGMPISAGAISASCLHAGLSNPVDVNDTI